MIKTQGGIEFCFHILRPLDHLGPIAVLRWFRLEDEVHCGWIRRVDVLGVVLGPILVLYGERLCHEFPHRPRDLVLVQPAAFLWPWELPGSGYVLTAVNLMPCWSLIPAWTYVDAMSVIGRQETSLSRRKAMW